MSVCTYFLPTHNYIYTYQVDRPTSRVADVENEILELFLNLDASEEQLDYPTLYASAKEGKEQRRVSEPTRGHGVSNLSVSPIRTYLHTYIHTYIHTYQHIPAPHIPTYLPTYLPTYIQVGR